MRTALTFLCLAALVLPTGCDWGKEGTKVTMTSTSPDRRSRLEMVEITGRMDRNFFLRLSDLGNGNTTNIFYSPDEGNPEGERIIWSRDGSRVLLTGRYFGVGTNAILPDGQILYLLYDLKSGELKCNSSQQDLFRGFNRKDVEGIDWMESIEQDGAANRSQPVASATNRTSAAAGSGR